VSMWIGEEVQAVLRQDHAALTFAEPLKKRIRAPLSEAGPRL
jgi:hypothetical protein